MGTAGGGFHFSLSKNLLLGAKPVLFVLAGFTYFMCEKREHTSNKSPVYCS